MIDKEHGIVICDNCKEYMTCGGYVLNNKKGSAICYICLEELYFDYVRTEKPPNMKIKENIIVIRLIIKEKDRNRVFERDGYKCVKCSATQDLTIDHIKPFSKGGKSNIKNYQTLCKSCNSKKHTTYGY